MDDRRDGFELFSFTFFDQKQSPRDSNLTTAE